MKAAHQEIAIPAGASSRSLHRLGVVCGLAAGAWLGGAEAPTKLVTVGFSPFIISLGMVAGVFVARWTVPMVLKGTSYVWLDLKEKAHLIVWAILAGMLWAVANTLTVFAIRNVGLSIAFPLWNTNSLVGLFWGWLLFNELRGAKAREWTKVMGGARRLLWVRAFLPMRRSTTLLMRRSRPRSGFWLPSVPACFGARCTYLIAKPTSAA